MKSTLIGSVLLLLLVGASQRARAATYAQLDALGVVSVKDPKFAGGAKGDGETDDTAAIQAAINGGKSQSKIILFPAGTYLVSKTLECYKPNRMDGTPQLDGGLGWNTFFLRGSSRGPRPVIKLKNNTPPFNRTIGSVTSNGEVGKTSPLFCFATFRDENRNLKWDYTDTNGNGVPDGGEGEEENGGNSFHFNLINIDIDLGSGNSSAFGVRMLGAQNSSIQDVKIDASGGFGGIKDFSGSHAITANIEVVGGRVGLWGGPQHATVVAGVKLTNQTEYAFVKAADQCMTLTGFHITKADAPAIIANATGNTPFGGDIAFIDGIIEFTNAPNGSNAIVNTSGQGIYMHNVFVKNASQIIKSGNRAAVPGRAGWKKITEYASPDLNNSYPGYNLINGAQNTTEYKTITDCNQSDVPSNLVSRHLWDPDDFPSPDDIYDRVHLDNDPTVAIATEHGVVIDDTYPNISSDYTGPDCREALQNLIDSGKKLIFLPKGKYLVKKNPSANYGIILGENTTLMGLAANYSQIITHTDWNPTAEIPVLTTPDSATATCKVGFLGVGFKVNPWTNTWFNSFHWRAGKNSMTRTTINPTVGPREDRTQVRADMLFTGNAGGRHYMIGSGGTSARDSEPFTSDSGGAGGFHRIRVEGTSQPLAFYSANAEDGFDKPQSLVVGSSNVIFYATKAEDRYGFGFQNSINCAIIGSGGRAEVDFNNCPDSMAALIVHKNANFNSASLTEAGSTTPKNVPLGLFKRGSFDWSKVEIIPGASDSSVRISNIKRYNGD